MKRTLSVLALCAVPALAQSLNPNFQVSLVGGVRF
jgi:hypothetical protein